KELVVVAQKDSSKDEPGVDDLYTVGTRAVIRKTARPRPDHIDIMVLGTERVVLMKMDQNEYLKAKVRALPLPSDASNETEALTLSLTEVAAKFVGMVQGQPQQEALRVFAAQEDVLQLAFMVASIMNLDAAREQSLLETPSRLEALRMVLGWLTHEVGVAELRNKIADQARSEMTKEQRDYVLRQQKKAI